MKGGFSMYTMNDEISVRQAKVLLILDMLSAGALVLPRTAVEMGQQDGWVLVIGGTLFAFVYGWFIVRLVQRFPQETFVNFAGKIVTKPIAMMLNFLFLLFLLISASFEVRIFGELLKQVLLPKTPIEVLIISMLLVCGYITRKGYECRGRIGEILFFVSIGPLLLILLFALPNVEISNLAPFFQISWKKLIWGSFNFSLSYIGILLLFFANVFIQPPNKSHGIVRSSLLTVGILNLMINIITVSIFGVSETKKQIWPVMTLMQVVHLPASLIERQEALMIIFWVITVFSLVSGYLYFSSIIITKMLKSKEQSYLVFPLLPIIYIPALIPSNIVEVYKWYRWLYRSTGILFLVILPFLLWSIAKIRKVGGPVD